VGVIRRNMEREMVDKLIRTFSIKVGAPLNPAKSLSGGNQQKVVIAKWLATDARILILDEPTRGVDVGAKVEIYHLINDLVAGGVGVLMISSELNEIIGMCDRVMVIDNGCKRGELVDEAISEKSIMKLVVGGNG
jgi:ribose transport system ATP-binding protein